MSLVLTSNYSAITPGRQASFFGSGGVAPYTYSVQPGGAGGSINSATGIYTAPPVKNSDPSLSSDTILVTDNVAATASLPILITDALGLVCDILQHELGLTDGRVYLWDQKIFQPTDSGLYIAVGVLRAKPFGNTVSLNSGSGVTGVESVNMQATLTIDAISRGPEARDRKEEIILALGSLYSQSQQEANSFSIGRLPANGQFNNISEVDGAAIPYRFQIQVNVQYFVTVIKGVPYFDTFSNPTPVTEP